MGEVVFTVTGFLEGMSDRGWFEARGMAATEDIVVVQAKETETCPTGLDH